MSEAVPTTFAEVAGPLPTWGTRSWYVVNQAEDPDIAEVMIYDGIGEFGITASQFVSDLAAITAKQINLRINSPGGNAFEATAIYNALALHPARVVVHVDGLAASAGSVIAMSGDEVLMADNAYMMIHESRIGVHGDAEEHRRYADMLEKINDNIAGVYQRKSGKPKSHWRTLMSAETWMTAAEARAEGLADGIYKAKDRKPAAQAAFDFTVYNRVPDAVMAEWGNPAAPLPQQPEQPAPENSPCGEPQPVAHQQETQPMADSTPPVTAPAQPPAAGTSVSAGDNIAQLNNAAIQGYIEKGRQLGYAEGQRAAAESFRSIMAAAPGRADIAANAFLAGQNAQTVALIFDADNRARQEARAEVMKKDEEIARLHAVHATGGHAGVGFSASPIEIGAGVPEGLDPQAQAQMEYDTNPLIRAKNPDKKTWMLYRVNQLRGNVRVLAVK